MAELKLGEELGAGGFCVVHEIVGTIDDDGNLTATSPPLAIKRIQDQHLDDEEVIARFQRDARLLDDVLDHPNIVPIYMRNLSVDKPFFVMPKAQGNLGDEIADNAGNESWILSRYRVILEAMTYAHGKGVIHRDLKPENALLVDGVLMLTDFGLGKDLDGGTVGLTKTFFGAGTEPYMAPEQWNALKDSDATADVFALGKLLLHMLTGEEPMVGTPDVSDLPEKYRYFISRCCEHKPENRFEDAKEVLEAFDRLSEKPVYVEIPIDALKALVEQWFAAPPGPEDLEVTRKIDEHLRALPEEEAMYTKEVPRLPDDLIEQYMRELPGEFEAMISIYDRHVSGGLNFDYCDVVARFYEDIFRSTDSLALRKLILTRLVLMGHSHDRWFVREHTMGLISDFSDPSTIGMAVDVLRTNPEAARWFGKVAEQQRLPEAIWETFKKLEAEGGDH